MTTYVYLCGDDARADVDYIAVEKTQLEACPGGWFARVFGGSMAPPTPAALLDVAGAATPVYRIAAPHAVLREFVHAIRFPSLLVDMARHLPLALKKKMTLATWRTYLEFYGLVDAKERPDTAAKKAKWDPQYAYTRRVAEALAEFIKDRHPHFSRLLVGERASIDCQFATAVVATSRLDPHMTTLFIPGEPAVTHVPIARYLCHDIPSCLGDCSTHVPRNAPCTGFFKKCMEEVFRRKCTIVRHAATFGYVVDVKHWPFAQPEAQRVDSELADIVNINIGPQLQ